MSTSPRSKTNLLPPAAELPVPADLTFPGRSTLNVHEVAEKLSVSDRHIVSLIEEGKLRAINVGGENVSGRRFYRIADSDYERYVREQTL